MASFLESVGGKDLEIKAFTEVRPLLRLHQVQPSPSAPVLTVSKASSLEVLLVFFLQNV